MVVLILAMLLWSVGLWWSVLFWPRRSCGAARLERLRLRLADAQDRGDGGILIVTEIVAGGSWRNARRTSSTWSPGSATLSTGWARRMLFPRASRRIAPIRAAASPCPRCQPGTGGSEGLSGEALGEIEEVHPEGEVEQFGSQVDMCTWWQ